MTSLWRWAPSRCSCVVSRILRWVRDEGFDCCGRDEAWQALDSDVMVLITCDEVRAMMEAGGGDGKSARSRVAENGVAHALTAFECLDFSLSKLFAPTSARIRSIQTVATRSRE